MHFATGCVKDIWEELNERYDSVTSNDLSQLYEKLANTINKGPESDDPKLWISEIKQVDLDVKRAGGKTKDNDELKALIKPVMKGTGCTKI
jgi:hypothetical protein